MAQRVKATAVTPETLIAGRYRLDREVRTRPSIGLWCATDTVLDRSVAIHIVSDLSKHAAGELTAAASRAGAVPDARWVRVLDVGTAPGGSTGTKAGATCTAWIISEWVEGATLTETVGREPLRPANAAALVLGCAQAVSAATRCGATHGGLHPGEVIIATDGHPRITGLEVHRMLPGLISTQPSAEVPETVALGGLLYAALTGRWPLPGWSGLPGPRRGDGRHPREQRRGVPRDLDEITATALSGGYPDPDAMVRALAAVPMPNPTLDADDRERPSRHRIRRVAWWVLPPILVAGVGVSAWVAGSDLGKVPGADRTTPAVAAPHPAKLGKPGTRLVWTKPPAVTSFDPDGDGAEDPGGVGLAVDADPSTQWSTDIYHGNAHFGGLKPGVGLLIDLGRAKRVDAARLTLSAPGAALQLRAGNAVPQQAGDLPIVARATDAPTSTRLTLARATKARYWLVWITSLPPSHSDDYSLGIAEVALLH